MMTPQDHPQTNFRSPQSTSPLFFHPYATSPTTGLSPALIALHMLIHGNYGSATIYRAPDIYTIIERIPSTDHPTSNQPAIT